MAVVKFVDKEYSRPEAICNLVNYAINPEHCICGLYGTQGIAKVDGSIMAGNMIAVKEVYGKTTRRQVLHCIISFSEYEMKYITPRIAQLIGYEVSAFFEGYQVVFGIHDNEDNLHIHFIINTTSYIDGKQYAIGPVGVYKLKSVVDNIVRKYISHDENVMERIDALRI